MIHIILILYDTFSSLSFTWPLGELVILYNFVTRWPSLQAICFNINHLWRNFFEVWLYCHSSTNLQIQPEYYVPILSLICFNFSFLSCVFKLQTGKTKVFLRAGQMADLDARRVLKLSSSAKVIQRKIRAYLTRKFFRSIVFASVALQSFCRGVSNTVHFPYIF